MLLTLLSLLGAPALAGPQETRDSLQRLREMLELRIEDGTVPREAVRPAILVQAKARYEETEGWFATSTVEVLQRALGSGTLRVCEACMAPRAWIRDGTMAYQTGPIGLDEVVRLDEQMRGPSEPARAAIWVEEHASGVSVRMVDLKTGAVLFAKNLDPDLRENHRTQRTYTLTEELERRSRGDSLTQVFFDFGVYPQQHISIDWTDQFGTRNQHMAGFTLSAADPVLGIGGNYHFVTPVFDATVGGQVTVALPTALAQVLGDAPDLFDPLLNGAFVVRVPFGRSNYGLVGSVSTNGRFSLGVSLMNISALPFLP